MVSLFKKVGKKNLMIRSEDGALQVAHHFYDTGHIKIGYLGPSIAPDGNNKLAGFQKGLEEHNLSLHAVLECNQHETAENQKAYQIISKYFDEHDPTEVTAWFAHSDIAASDIIRALIQRGIRVPEDVSVCGYNDTLLSRKMIPSLTSVASPIDEIARNAIELLIHEIRNDTEEETLQLSPHLYVRESTSCKITK